ncbi:MAG: hypothetical protein R3C03_21605 [Pirellulaceae bacterium]
MWKSFFFAVGIFLFILGAETLVVDKFVMTDSRRLPRLVSPDQYNSGLGRTSSPFSNAAYQIPGQGAQRRVIQTKDWMPWSLLAAGAITMMYTSTISNRKRGSDSGE